MECSSKGGVRCVPVGKGEGDPEVGEGDPDVGEGEPEVGEVDLEEGEGEPEEVEGEGLVLPLGDGGVDVPGGGGGGEGVELATHEPNPSQICPDRQTCMSRPSFAIVMFPPAISHILICDGLPPDAVADIPAHDGSPACIGTPVLRNKAGQLVN